MKTSRLSIVLVAVAVFFTRLSTPAHAQNSPREAAEMLYGLNIQIAEAQRAGDRKRVLLLQDRYMDIKRKWNVEPRPPNRPPVVIPVPKPTPWLSVQNGSGKLTGHRGIVRLRRAAATLPDFWDEGKNPNRSGQGATLKFTDVDGDTYTYTGNWNYRGNRAVSLRVLDDRGGVYTGTLTMAPRTGISTISLVGEGRAEGRTLSFSE